MARPTLAPALALALLAGCGSPERYAVLNFSPTPPAHAQTVELPFGSGVNGTELLMKALALLTEQGATGIHELAIHIDAGDQVCTQWFVPAPGPAHQPPQGLEVTLVQETAYRCRRLTEQRLVRSATIPSMKGRGRGVSTLDNTWNGDAKLFKKLQCEGRPVTHYVARYPYQLAAGFTPPDMEQVAAVFGSARLVATTPVCSDSPRQGHRLTARVTKGEALKPDVEYRPSGDRSASPLIDVLNEATDRWVATCPEHDDTLACSSSKSVGENTCSPAPVSVAQTRSADASKARARLLDTLSRWRGGALLEHVPDGERGALVGAVARARYHLGAAAFEEHLSDRLPPVLVASLDADKLRASAARTQAWLRRAEKRAQAITAEHERFMREVTGPAVERWQALSKRRTAQAWGFIAAELGAARLMGSSRNRGAAQEVCDALAGKIGPYLELVATISAATSATSPTAARGRRGDPASR